MAEMKKPGIGWTGILSDTALSNLFTMAVASKVDPRQKIPSESYVIPSEEIRRARARLILEEALEACNALGFSLLINTGSKGTANLPAAVDVDMKQIDFLADREPDLEEIIDACCDTIYVCVGTLLACGVPDLPHQNEVDRANNSKFPGGVAVVNEHGKFQKPDGWKKPDHLGNKVVIDLNNIAKVLLDLMDLLGSGEIGKNGIMSDPDFVPPKSIKQKEQSAGYAADLENK